MYERHYYLGVLYIQVWLHRVTWHPRNYERVIIWANMRGYSLRACLDIVLLAILVLMVTENSFCRDISVGCNEEFFGDDNFFFFGDHPCDFLGKVLDSFSADLAEWSSFYTVSAALSSCGHPTPH